MTDHEFDSFLLWLCRAMRGVGDKWKSLCQPQGDRMTGYTESGSVTRFVWFRALRSIGVDEAQEAVAEILATGTPLAFDRVPGEIRRRAVAARPDTGAYRPDPQPIGRDGEDEVCTSDEILAEVRRRAHQGNIFAQAVLNRIEARLAKQKAADEFLTDDEQWSQVVSDLNNPRDVEGEPCQSK